MSDVIKGLERKLPAIAHVDPTRGGRRPHGRHRTGRSRARRVSDRRGTPGPHAAEPPRSCPSLQDGEQSAEVQLPSAWHRATAPGHPRRCAEVCGGLRVSSAAVGPDGGHAVSAFSLVGGGHRGSQLQTPLLDSCKTWAWGFKPRRADCSLHCDLAVPGSSRMMNRVQWDLSGRRVQA